MTKEFVTTLEQLTKGFGIPVVIITSHDLEVSFGIAVHDITNQDQ